jgi:hypothetical protein
MLTLGKADASIAFLSLSRMLHGLHPLHATWYLCPKATGRRTKFGNGLGGRKSSGMGWVVENKCYKGDARTNNLPINLELPKIYRIFASKYANEHE